VEGPLVSTLQSLRR